MRSAPLLLVALTLAGCADDAMAYDATFAAVPGESGKYTLKVLNATLDNVTVEVTAPSRPNALVPRDDLGVLAVRRHTVGSVSIEVVVDLAGAAAPATVPTWTLRLEGLRRNTYALDAVVQTRICGGGSCQQVALGEVQNFVTVR